MKVEEHAVVLIHYVLTNDDKEVLDSSEGQEPLAYLHGTGHLIPGLEAQLLGKAAGDQLDVTVQPNDGYGEFNEELVQTVSSDVFDGVDAIEPGMQFQTSNDDGSGGETITVINVENDEVTIDGNHPLAGVTLHFAVDIVNVREATAEELEHGHVH
ncbi:MAG: peptidylprolyl isomerase [Pseudomonadales bacterium]|jgi:FKBP-type peptidyl-prolyl cis-trans isomerase SlyD|tara:strand:+ start:2083 stop:2550 length:468 start_codon:yes stop_codon:yes gene_type:complete